MECCVNLFIFKILCTYFNNMHYFILYSLSAVLLRILFKFIQNTYLNTWYHLYLKYIFIYCLSKGFDSKYNYIQKVFKILYKYYFVVYSNVCKFITNGHLQLLLINTFFNCFNNFRCHIPIILSSKTKIKINFR